MKFLAVIPILLAAAPCLFGQTATLNGRVTDESGAVVPTAKITINGPGISPRIVIAGTDGIYSFIGLPPGGYSITASAPQLAGQQTNITLRPGAQSINLELHVAATAAEVTVNADAGPAVSTNASSNANAMVLTGNDLDSLSDDPDDLTADLQALAGPAAGPDGAEIFIDGFSGGQLPPKQSIREVRLNQNPFAPEYDKVGLGRIEIFTKPGSDAYHATITYNLGTDLWNSRNPYAAQKAPFLLQETENTFSGPLTKRSSFTLDISRQAVDNGSVSNGVTLDPKTFAITPFTTVLKTPQRHILIRPHFDYQLNANNYLAVTYTLSHVDIPNEGIGAFDLISRGYHLLNHFDTAQAIETSVHGATINETHFQYYRWGDSTTADTTGPAIQVLGAFNGGAASSLYSHDVQTAYEVQNITSIVRGAHVFRFGTRMRLLTDDSYSLQGFNGAFTFTSIDQYQLTELSQPGGGAAQFTIAAGNPVTRAKRFDAAEFLGDDWRIRPNFTLNLGIRFESQTNISDHLDVAPRMGFAWAPGATATKAGKTVIRGGYGIFYTRFTLSDSVTALRYNGIVQQQYVVTNPDFFPNVPLIAALGVNPSIQSTREIDSNLRAPYLMQSIFTAERQLKTGTTLAATYTNIHGLHILRSEDINAPVQGTGIYPHPGTGPIFLATSSGLYNQNQLSFNLNSKLSEAASLYVTYTLNKAMSNTDGLGTFPGNPYNYSSEYGPAFNDIRHRIVFGGSINTKWNVRFNPLVSFQTGAPFNITSGNDPYGTTLYTARPGIGADPSKPGLIETPYGLLDPNPAPGEQILGRNAGRGPFQIQTNLRVTKTWGFGAETSPAAASGSPFANPASHRYNLSVAMSARNLLNHNNPGPIVGNITSPLFGQANQVAGSPNGEGLSENASNRRLELQLRFTF
jgi:hypothetical protein